MVLRRTVGLEDKGIWVLFSALLVTMAFIYQITKLSGASSQLLHEVRMGPRKNLKNPFWLSQLVSATRKLFVSPNPVYIIFCMCQVQKQGRPHSKLLILMFLCC